jgi:hypothetical protein
VFLPGWNDFFGDYGHGVHSVSVKVIEDLDSFAESVDESSPDSRAVEKRDSLRKPPVWFSQTSRAVRAGATPGSSGRAEGAEPGVAPARTAVPGPAPRRHLGEGDVCGVIALPLAGRGNQARNIVCNIHSVGWLLAIRPECRLLIARNRREEVARRLLTALRRTRYLRDPGGSDPSFPPVWVCPAPALFHTRITQVAPRYSN